MKPRTQVRIIKGVITVGALAAFGVRLVYPALNLDAVALGLLLLAVVPWLSPLIKSAELPGGFKIEFQDVKEAAEKVAAGEPAVLQQLPAARGEMSYLEIAEHDPRIGLILLRVEIEKRLREMAELADVPSRGSLSNLMRDLANREILSGETMAGLRDLIDLGNRAAHGVPVAFDAAYAAIDFGPRVLAVLDTKLTSLRKGAA